MLWCISGTFTPIEMTATGSKNIHSFRSRQVRLAMGNLIPKIVRSIINNHNRLGILDFKIPLKGPYCKLSTYNAFQRHANGDV